MRRGPPKPDRKGGLKQGPPQKRIANAFEEQKKQAQRQALNALKRAKRTADKAGVELSDWEGEFLGSVADRVKTYGRAFGDPEKGGPGSALSIMQAVKLKEIAAKAKGEKKGLQRGKGFARKRPVED